MIDAIRSLCGRVVSIVSYTAEAWKERMRLARVEGFPVRAALGSTASTERR